MRPGRITPRRYWGPGIRRHTDFWAGRNLRKQMCIRDRDGRGISALGGIYSAGVFGKGSYAAWEGDSRELCNLPNALRARIKINGRPAEGPGENGLQKSGEAGFFQKLDMKQGIYERRYPYTEKGAKAALAFRRFAVMDERWKNVIGQEIEIRAEEDGLELSLIHI